MKDFRTAKMTFPEVLHIVHTAILFRQGDMNAWWNRRGGRVTPGYITGLYVGGSKKKTYVVAKMNIEAFQTLVILTKETNITPAELKKMANRGDLGQKKDIERITIPFHPYIFIDGWYVWS